MIAALFVETNGVYFGLSEVTPYDKKRNALTYQGPWPVVAHPPCQLWGNFAPINYKRWGGEHNRPGNDGGMFQFALWAVNTFGGVLEHPALSKAWATYGLVKPLKGMWTPSGAGFTCEVSQSAYGCPARKKTWLYYRGSVNPLDPCWGSPEGTHQIGRDQRGKALNKPKLGGAKASRTPPQFRDYLLSLARLGALQTSL